MNNQNARWAPYGLGGGRGGAEGQPPEGPEIIVINERELRAFIYRVYLSTVGLCLLSAIPWIVLSALVVNVYKDIPVPPFVWLLLSLIIEHISGTPFYSLSVSFACHSSDQQNNNKQCEQGRGVGFLCGCFLSFDRSYLAFSTLAL